MSESIVKRTNAMPTGGPELQKLLAAMLVDITALRTAIAGITAQLDADDGVTDTDYAADNDPAALTVVD